jgi:phosphate transport system substrate-binding protein
VVQIPESAGPVCITYNLSDLKQPLKLSPKSLAGIFLGTIKNWQDPALKKDNPGVSLPKDNIVVAHRSESSGTTNIFTNYLDAASPEWHGKVGKGLSVNWPVGVGGKGSEGVTGVVKQTPGGIGYVELTYATENQLPSAEVENAAGKYVPPSAESASATVDAFSQQLSSDVRTPIVNPPASAADAYPISGLTFLLIPKQPKDPARGQAMTNFVKYVLTTGQDQAGQLHYSKLPPSLQQVDQQLLSQVSGQGGDNKSPGGQ